MVTPADLPACETGTDDGLVTREVVIHEPDCPGGLCDCDQAGVTLGDPDQQGPYPGAVTLVGDDIVKPWRYR